MAMNTKYIGPLTADLSDQTRTARVEIRLEPSEAYAGHLALSINSYTSGITSGKEFILVHLDDIHLADLSDAIDEYNQRHEGKSR